MDLDDIITVVFARYESDLLYEIINYYSKKNVLGKYISIDIEEINEIIEDCKFLNKKNGAEKAIAARIVSWSDDRFDYRHYHYATLKRSFFYAEKISEFDNQSCLHGLKFLKKLYATPLDLRESVSKNIQMEEINDQRLDVSTDKEIVKFHDSFSSVYKTEFRHWLICCDGKSNATANNYISGFNLAQRHYNLCSQSNLSFYDTKDIYVLQLIFDKYINGEYSQIGKKYSGAVRASLQAYLRFLRHITYNNEEPAEKPLSRKAMKTIEMAKRLAEKFGIPVEELLKKISEMPDNPNSSVQSNPYYKKALRKISGWARASWQQNHKLIKSYFKAYHMFEEPPTKKMLQKICSDINNPEFYVRDFVGTYNSLKADGVSTNGKVFEDDGERVQIWEEIKDELLKYEKYFYNSENQ